MSTITYDEFCLAVSRELAEVAGEQGNPLLNRQQTGLLSALTDPINQNGMEATQLKNPGDGKAHQVLLKYLKPDSTALVTDEITSICDEEGASEAYAWDTVPLGLEVQSAVKKITQTQMRELCDNPLFRSQVISGMMNPMAKKINQMLIEPFQLGSGGIIGGNGAIGTEYELIYRDGQPAVGVEGYHQMLRDLRDTGINGLPIVVGGSKIDLLATLKGISCCNNVGIDPSQMTDLAIFYDNDINTQLTPSDADWFFAFAPGAAQFVYGNDYVGEFRLVTDYDINDTILDPISGLRYDFEAYWDRCDKLWKMKMSLKFDLWQLPLDLFKSGDDRFKVNFNYTFQVTEGSPS